MTASGAAVSDGYEAFFGLKESPFSLTPNPRFLFGSATHMAALDQVTYALRRREPLIVITGEIGTGKTMLCRTVLDRIERLTFLSIIADPLLGRDDLLKQILEDFGVISKGRGQLVQPSRHELIRALQEFLTSLIPLQAHAVVMIDEAQHLHPEVLEEIRLLSNIEADQGTQLQIVLVGQSDLEVALKRPDMRQFQQRVTRRFRLEPLDPRETRRYIEHRLAVAGRDSAPALFTGEAMDGVAQLSAGLPRVINIVCDRALEAAYRQGRHVVDLATVEATARTLGMPPPAPAALSAVGGPALPAPSKVETFPRSADFDRLFEEAAASAPHRASPPRVTSPAPPAVLSLPDFPDRGYQPDLRDLPGPSDLPDLPERSGLPDLSDLSLPVLGEVDGPGPREVEEPAPSEAEPDLATFEPLAETPKTRRYLIAGIVVAAVAVGVWFATRTTDAPPAPPRTAPAAPSAPRPAAPAPAPVPAPGAAPAPTATVPGQPAPAAGTPPPATEPAGAVAEPAVPGGRFEIVVASFRTDSRAATVAQEVTALGLTHRMRTVGDGWRQVLVGPYATRAEAEAAQQRLDEAGLGNSQIVAR